MGIINKGNNGNDMTGADALIKPGHLKPRARPPSASSAVCVGPIASRSAIADVLSPPGGASRGPSPAGAGRGARAASPGGRRAHHRPRSASLSLAWLLALLSVFGLAMAMGGFEGHYQAARGVVPYGHSAKQVLFPDCPDRSSSQARAPHVRPMIMYRHIDIYGETYITECKAVRWDSS